jgi:hypothetical protein
VEIGSEAHKELFCRTFLEGHRKYEPEDLPWPDLEGEPLELLRGIPFWEHALQAELDAGPMLYACAELASDPLVREALSLQGYEETRHGRTIRHMIDRYDIEVEEPEVTLPSDVESGFIDFGFEECLDSFGAFGLFALAKEAELVPDEFFEIFGQVMQEEAHHIVFFVNWFEHRQVQRGGVASALRRPRSLWHYGKALYKLADLVRDDDADEGADFIATGASVFVDNLTARMTLARCLAENERRLAGFDRRLLVPRLMPQLARIALAGFKLIPERGAAPGNPTQGDASSRAA